MTTEEIKDLIASKIAGQGNQVDSGGALPTILNEIVDMASQGGATPIEIPCTFNHEKERVDPTEEGEAIIREKGFDAIGAVLTFDSSPVPPATGPNTYNAAKIIALRKSEGDTPCYDVYFYNFSSGEIGEFTVDLT